MRLKAGKCGNMIQIPLEWCARRMQTKTTAAFSTYYWRYPAILLRLLRPGQIVDWGPVMARGPIVSRPLKAGTNSFLNHFHDPTEAFGTAPKANARRSNSTDSIIWGVKSNATNE